MSRPDRQSQRGQILPIFALTVVALFAMAALLFDAAQALVVRRQTQDATDAAALAAANVIQSGSPRGCSTTAGPPPGAPRTAVADAARASLTANLSAALAAAATITCPSGWDNTAVRVELTRTAPSFFAAILGRGAFTVSTRSTAVNGYGNGLGFSVITLNPYVPGYSQNTRGCPSVIFAGAPRVAFEGNLQVNSACPRTDNAGPALQMSGVASQITFSNGAQAYVVGEADDTTRVNLNPPPVEGAPVLADPLANLPPVAWTSLPVRSTTRITLNNSDRAFDPGVYTGGIELRNRSRAFFRPGIYVIDGGGIRVGAQAEVYTVRAGVSSTTSSNWANDCTVTDCGAMFYNKANSTGSMGQFYVTAGAVFKIRPYRYELDSSAAARIQYTGMALWQHRVPELSQGYQEQPTVELVGGGEVYLAGTVYTPNAKVVLSGGSGGGSGSYDIDYALQFVVKDVQFGGTAYWRMQYSDATFVRPPDYGLVE